MLGLWNWTMNEESPNTPPLLLGGARCQEVLQPCPLAFLTVSTTLMLMNVYSICQHIPDAPLRIVFAVYGSTLSLL